MKSGLVPEPTLRRLPWYLAYVALLRKDGVEYVSSTAISRHLNVDASQTAKDLSFLSIRGKTRIGYDVARLETELRGFLGFSRQHNAVIVGAGSLGRALMADHGLRRYGLNIVAGFDIDPDVIGSDVDGIRVYHMADLACLRQALGAEIGIVAVPAEEAQNVADALVEAGVKALWNFTPFRIHVDGPTVIHNTSIYAHLAMIYNRMMAMDDDKKKQNP